MAFHHRASAMHTMAKHTHNTAASRSSASRHSTVTTSSHHHTISAHHPSIVIPNQNNRTPVTHVMKESLSLEALERQARYLAVNGSPAAREFVDQYGMELKSAPQSKISAVGWAPPAQQSHNFSNMTSNTSGEMSSPDAWGNYHNLPTPSAVRPVEISRPVHSIAPRRSSVVDPNNFVARLDNANIAEQRRRSGVDPADLPHNSPTDLPAEVATYVRDHHRSERRTSQHSTVLAEATAATVAHRERRQSSAHQPQEGNERERRRSVFGPDNAPSAAQNGRQGGTTQPAVQSPFGGFVLGTPHGPTLHFASLTKLAMRRNGQAPMPSASYPNAAAHGNVCVLKVSDFGVKYHGSWKARQMVLTHDSLILFKTHADMLRDKIDRRIPLGGIDAIIPVARAEHHGKLTEERHWYPFALTLFTPEGGRETLVVRCGSPHERAGWIDQFMKRVNLSKSGPNDLGALVHELRVREANPQVEASERTLQRWDAIEAELKEPDYKQQQTGSGIGARLNRFGINL